MNKKSGSEQSVCLEAMLSWPILPFFTKKQAVHEAVKDLLKLHVKIKLEDKITLLLRFGKIENSNLKTDTFKRAGYLSIRKHSGSPSKMYEAPWPNLSDILTRSRERAN